MPIIAFNNGSTNGNVATDVSENDPLPVTPVGSGPEGEINVNLNQIDGNSVSTGTGATGTGVQRVQLTNDYASTVTSQGLGYTSRTDVTRPANQTPYSIGDVVGGVITFTNAGPSGGRVLITTADLGLYISAIPSGMTSFTLYLYDASPGSAIADNSPFDMPATGNDRASYLGQIALGTPVDLGATCYTAPVNPNIEVKLASASTSLYGYLTTATAYTPAANSEVYSVRFSSIGVSN